MSDDQEQPKQKFTGYWIPAELGNLGLSKTEQMLLSLIDSLDAPAPDYCFASNKYLAEHMDLSESRISFYLTKFKRMGLIIEVGFDGRRRRIACLKENWYKRDFEKEQSNSKKELCVKTRTEGTRNHVGRPRENTYHIIKKITKKKNNTLEESASPPVCPPDGGEKEQAIDELVKVIDKQDLPFHEKDIRELCKKYSEKTVREKLLLYVRTFTKKSKNADIPIAWLKDALKKNYTKQGQDT